jgi:hypothetical protein
MNKYLAAAGGLAFLVGCVHSILGERMIFRRMRTGSVIPTNGGKVIGEGHVRIIWASWHVLTVLGWLLAAALVWLATLPVQLQNQTTLLSAIATAMLVSSALVLVATKARHPGWAGLLGVAALTWLGQGA